MRSFWTPLSALLVPDPPAYASPALLRLLLRSGKPVALLYAGDRMWPAVRHAQRIVVDPIAPGDVPAAGAIVVGCPDGIPDLFRLESLEGRVAHLRCDAEPGAVFDVPAESLLARAQLPLRGTRDAARALRRLYLDLRETIGERPDAEPDPAGTVRAKYDAQAPFYAGVASPEMAEGLLAWIRARLDRGGRILVAGSGTGRESFALAEHGWTVTGVDFSRPMVEIAKREAERRGLAASFLLADLRTHEEPQGSLAAVYFTYDVYSFLPKREDRMDLLKRMARWLAPDGVVFLSARRFERLYDPFILTLQRAVRLGDPEARWGQSHTRWIAPDGALHRSFVQVFTTRGLAREVEAAGFLVKEWRGSHCLLVRGGPGASA